MARHPGWQWFLAMAVAIAIVTFLVSWLLQTALVAYGINVHW